jgi:RNA polymerase sigma factor (sigma-70 family)
MSDWELLQAYAKNRSESAFAKLVARHLDWVHSVALRHVGDPHLAEDVVQSVFLLLACKARDIRCGTILGGWLFRTTCHVAAHAQRAEQRRKNRESTASTMIYNTNSPENDDTLWQQLAPYLDLAVATLPEADRSAILLRFYEKATMHKVGESLGISEDAAKKRVSRAVERMRDFLVHRGVRLGGVALVGLLAEKTVWAAPAKTASAVTKIALAASSASASLTLPPLAQETLRAWRWAKVKLAAGLIAGSLALIILCVSVGSRFSSRSQAQSAATTGLSGPDASMAANQNRNGLSAAKHKEPPAEIGALTDNLSLTGKVVDKFSDEPVP